MAFSRSILKRYTDDEITRMRLHYTPYYKTFSKQNGTRVWLEGKELVMMASNDYLGLVWHPKVIAAGVAALEQWGASPTGSRMANGSRAYHTQLEEALAAFIGVPSAHVFSAGYLACMASVAGFAQKSDLILADKNLHSSLMAGIGQTNAEVVRFSHNSPTDLAEILATEKPDRPKFVVLEGVYSMEGHLCPLDQFTEKLRDQNAMVVLDDAHGLGVMGPNGRGTPAHFGLTNKVDIYTGSLSKSLASVGGFVAGSHSMVEYLRTHAKQLIFSAALPPAQAACALAALEVLQNEPEYNQKLWENTRRYHAFLRSLGLDIWETQTPATPIIVGSRDKAFKLWRRLMDNGLFTVMSVAPAVPAGKDLIRTAISAAHTPADFEIIEKAFRAAVKGL